MSLSSTLITHSLGLLVATLSLSSNCISGDKPNILWITTEDIGPHLGCYGDKYAETPHLDALAKRGILFSHAWSNAPVCAAARTTLISGMYPACLGAEHMRSNVPMPDGCKMYPQFLREAGYYCTNNSKEDYNLEKPNGTWNESSGKAHWLNRGKGQPFFAIFNITTTHESQIRKAKHQLKHDPAKAPLPAYHPDTPESRHDWAQYYDNITTMDGEFQARLDELDKAGLSEDTIIFFYGDHGAGMPRSKRFPYNSGLQVPLLAYFPPKWQHLAPKGYAPAGKSEELVAFIDLAPTMLSLAGVKVAPYMQGRAFAGEHRVAAPEFLYGFRGRMDERYDLIRSVTDGRYVYLRNYMPHLPYGQNVDYMMAMPTARVWKQMFADGKLNETQSRFWQTKPSEELYDLQSDPWEVKNLAGSAEYKPTLNKMRLAEQEQASRIRDLGFIPEADRLRLSAGKSPRDAFAGNDVYPFAEVLLMARYASDLSMKDTSIFITALSDKNSTVRWWGALGLAIRKSEGVKAGHDALTKLLADECPSVRIVAAEALGQYGSDADLPKALDTLIAAADASTTTWFTALEALNSIDRLDKKALPLKDRIASLPKSVKGVEGRVKEYIPRTLEKIQRNLE